MPTEYTLSDLAKLSGVSTRTVRFYIAQGLLPSPMQQGPNTRYTEMHLDRLRLIRRLQAAHLPLAQIRKHLGSLPDDQVASLAESEPAYDAAQDSALDYIESLLRPRRQMLAMPVTPASSAAIAASSRAPATAAPPPDKPVDKPVEPDRAQWERITLDADVELHIRRPLTRQQNKRVERLISIARQLLEEE